MYLFKKLKRRERNNKCEQSYIELLCYNVQKYIHFKNSVFSSYLLRCYFIKSLLI